MVVWPALARALCARYGVRAPIVQAPMADAVDWRVAAGAARAGVLGSIPCATLAADAIAPAAERFRESAPGAPLHLNFFTTHDAAAPTAARQQRWVEELAPYYKETGATPPSSAELVATNGRASFDADACAAVEAVRPDIVSFHFGLPEDALLDRVRATGASVWCTATTVAEAKALSECGVDVVIAQGAEAGGHRGSFLGDDCYMKPPLVGTMALIPQVVDAVSVPVIAAGGLADGRGVVAALALGASGVSVGTAFLRAEDSLINDGHRAALESSRDEATLVTNVYSGRPARGFANRLVRELGPISPAVPEFPWASTAVKPLAAADSEAFHGSRWAGQAAAVAPARGDGEAVAEWLVADAERVLGELL